MARRRYLIAYDIRDPKRLRRICKIMEGYGVRIQYSVFVCDLSDLEYVRWKTEIRKTISLGSDSIIEIDLGSIDRPRQITTIGVPRHLPPRGPIVL